MAAQAAYRDMNVIKKLFRRDGQDHAIPTPDVLSDPETQVIYQLVGKWKAVKILERCCHRVPLRNIGEETNSKSEWPPAADSNVLGGLLGTRNLADEESEVFVGVDGISFRPVLAAGKHLKSKESKIPNMGDSFDGVHFSIIGSNQVASLIIPHHDLLKKGALSFCKGVAVDPTTRDHLSSILKTEIKHGNTIRYRKKIGAALRNGYFPRPISCPTVDLQPASFKNLDRTSPSNWGLATMLWPKVGEVRYPIEIGAPILEAIQKYPFDIFSDNHALAAALSWCLYMNEPNHLQERLNQGKKHIPTVSLLHYIIYVSHLFRITEDAGLAAYQHPFRFVDAMYKADCAANEVYQIDPQDVDQYEVLHWYRRAGFDHSHFAEILPASFAGSKMQMPVDRGSALGPRPEAWASLCLDDIHTIGIPCYRNRPTLKGKFIGPDYGIYLIHESFLPQRCSSAIHAGNVAQFNTSVIVEPHPIVDSVAPDPIAWCAPQTKVKQKTDTLPLIEGLIPERTASQNAEATANMAFMPFEDYFGAKWWRLYRIEHDRRLRLATQAGKTLFDLKWNRDGLPVWDGCDQAFLSRGQGTTPFTQVELESRVVLKAQHLTNAQLESLRSVAVKAGMAGILDSDVLDAKFTDRSNPQLTGPVDAEEKGRYEEWLSMASKETLVNVIQKAMSSSSSTYGNVKDAVNTLAEKDIGAPPKPPTPTPNVVSDNTKKSLNDFVDKFLRHDDLVTVHPELQGLQSLAKEITGAQPVFEHEFRTRVSQASEKVLSLAKQLEEIPKDRPLLHDEFVHGFFDPLCKLLGTPNENGADFWAYSRDIGDSVLGDLLNDVQFFARKNQDGKNRAAITDAVQAIMMKEQLDFLPDLKQLNKESDQLQSLSEFEALLRPSTS
ncbi:hypothetical protein K4K58_009156 [Colletotrichum sp. SAR11_239]|nr:hypothetical protein K4K58_009156 [Colletotrichum sp. SAR11_239]